MSSKTAQGPAKAAAANNRKLVLIAGLLFALTGAGVVGSVVLGVFDKKSKTEEDEYLSMLQESGKFVKVGDTPISTRMFTTFQTNITIPKLTFPQVTFPKATLPFPTAKEKEPDPKDKPKDPDPKDKPKDPDPKDKPKDPDPKDKPPPGAAITQENFDKIQRDMEEAEVLGILGPPTRSVKTEPSEIPTFDVFMIWQDMDHWIVVTLAKGKVYSKNNSAGWPSNWAAPGGR